MDVGLRAFTPSSEAQISGCTVTAEWLVQSQSPGCYVTADKEGPAFHPGGGPSSSPTIQPVL